MKIIAKSGKTYEVYQHESFTYHVDTPLDETGTPIESEAQQSEPFRSYRQPLFIAKSGSTELSFMDLETLKKKMETL